MTKRLFDILVAGMGLLALSPFFAIVSILVKTDSPGPVFYRGIRTGLDGRPFRIFKFRTMVLNADQIGGPSTGKDDPRVTSIGRFLRRHKLDELPQLLNVLRGEMSIVGPRPEVPQYTSLYTGEERLILTVKPGITDFASVEFASLDEVLGENDPDRVYEEQVRPIKNRLRIKYVKERSLLVDARILLSTFVRLARK